MAPGVTELDITEATDHHQSTATIYFMLFSEIRAYIYLSTYIFHRCFKLNLAQNESTIFPLIFSKVFIINIPLLLW